MLRTLALTLTALTLAACGSSDSGSSGGDGFEDTKALADARECSATYEPAGPGVLPLGAKETATCQPGYTLTVFRDDEARDSFVKVVGSFGGTFAVGDGWAVGARNIAEAKAAAEKLGGTTV